MIKFVDLTKKILTTLMYIGIATPIYAYLTFYFIYPVICVIPIGVYPATGYLYLLYSFFIAIGIGILVEDGQNAFITVLLSAIFGYFIGYVYIGFPSYLYGYTLYTSDLMAIFFISMTWFLLVFYIIFGLFGVLIGGVIRDYLEEEE